MTFWKPSPIWQDQPCYIVGGGPSLKTFPWDVLRGLPVIGCNATCYLSPELVPWTVFGDASFLDNHRAALETYVGKGGQVVTNSSHFRKKPNVPPWLKIMSKLHHGLGYNQLGWNGNTGASAINLALLMGANLVYLLGFDMGLSSSGQANYHNAYNHKVNPKAYPRFQKGMGYVVSDMAKMFPGARVINLEDGTSKLTTFPKESLRGHAFKALVA